MAHFLPGTSARRSTPVLPVPVRMRVPTCSTCSILPDGRGHDVAAGVHVAVRSIRSIILDEAARTRTPEQTACLLTHRSGLQDRTGYINRSTWRSAKGAICAGCGETGLRSASVHRRRPAPRSAYSWSRRIVGILYTNTAATATGTAYGDRRPTTNPVLIPRRAGALDIATPWRYPPARAFR